MFSKTCQLGSDTLKDFDNRLKFNQIQPASWSNGNVFVSEAGGLRCKSRAGQVGSGVANCSAPLQHFFERSCVAGRNDTEMRPKNSLHASAKYSEYNEKLNVRFLQIKNLLFDLVILFKLRASNNSVSHLKQKTKRLMYQI